MIRSMTGYAIGTADCAQHGIPLHLSLEIKSVNSRFFDVQMRVCEELRQYEPLLRANISRHISRGKIECRLQIAGRHGDINSGALNAGNGGEAGICSPALSQLMALQESIRQQSPTAAPLSVAEILRWPGILAGDTLDYAALAPAIQALQETLLQEFQESRQREGGKLAAMILQCTAKMREIVAEVVPRIPELQNSFQEKLEQRLRDAFASAGIADASASPSADSAAAHATAAHPFNERILQELTVFAHRIDIAEEVSRLSAHIDEVERSLQKGGVSGKRLDFLAQELNREANTLGSKSVLQAVSQAAIELKLLIEQIREQAQNLE